MVRARILGTESMADVSAKPIEGTWWSSFASLVATIGPVAVLLAVSLESERLSGADRTEVSSVPEYKIGDLAIEDVIVPAGLTPPDSGLEFGLDGTGRLWVYRRDLEVTARVVEELQADFVRSQDRFREVLVEAFGELPIERRDVNSVRFRSLQATFQNRNEGFPVNYQLAVSWAYELDDSHFFLPVSLSVFESFVGRAVVPDGVVRPEDGDRVLVVPAGQIGDGDRPVAEILEDAVLIDGNSVDEISDVRERVYRALAGESLILAQYVARHIRPNAAIDDDLTADLRLYKESMDALAARLTAGAIIVRKGDRITEETISLLAELEKAVDESRTNRQDEGLLRSPSWLPSFLSPERFTSVNGWMVGFGLALVVAIAVWATSHLRKNKTRLPAVIVRPGDAGSFGAAGHDADAVLVRALRDRTVQALYSQHREFLAHEKSATDLLKDFERRIAALEPGSREKIRRYEARIEELERKLADKEAENRELIQRQIESTRKEIARELTGVGFENN
jgi:hypothetical protein